MAYDESVAQRIRGLIDPALPVAEKRMFGGLAFMHRGHMFIGVVKSELMVRVGPDAYQECLSLPHARPMDFTGKPMKGFLYVGDTHRLPDEALRGWLQRGLRFVASLPPK